MNMNDEARDLYFYTRNCEPAWRMAEAAFRNYERKIAKGTYDPARAQRPVLCHHHGRQGICARTQRAE